MSRPPAWLKKRLVSSDEIFATKNALSQGEVRTVCESSLCPNLNECFSKRCATFLILGPRCTRTCGFCAITKGAPEGVDLYEPDRIRKTVEQLGLRYVVITSVTRDDLPDGGAGQFVRVIDELRRLNPAVSIEVLVPDFGLDERAIGAVAAAKPDIFGHNIETAERLYPLVRRGAGYRRSLQLLNHTKELNPKQITKSGIMVGLGESDEEIAQTMRDIRLSGCDILTIGQYMRPRQANLPVSRFVTPEKFEEYKRLGGHLGFSHVSAGPFVRSSYHAEEMFSAVSLKN